MLQDWRSQAEHHHKARPMQSMDGVTSKLQHWRGFQAVCARKGAPVLEFDKFYLWKHDVAVSGAGRARTA
jgi:hypothetical protein